MISHFEKVFCFLNSFYTVKTPIYRNLLVEALHCREQ